jgi:hypothetical protein
MHPQNRPPVIAAKLDLSDDNQRTMHDFIRRSHTGRWPLWRALAMRQVGPYIFEVAGWQRRALPREARFCLVRFEPAACAVQWQAMPSRKAALAALSAASADATPTVLHAP